MIEHLVFGFGHIEASGVAHDISKHIVPVSAEAVGRIMHVPDDAVFGSSAHLDANVDGTSPHILDVMSVTPIGCEIDPVERRMQTDIDHVNIRTVASDRKRIGRIDGGFPGDLANDRRIGDAQAAKTRTGMQHDQRRCIRIVGAVIRRDLGGRDMAGRRLRSTSQFDPVPDVDREFKPVRTGRQIDDTAYSSQRIDRELQDRADVLTGLDAFQLFRQIDESGARGFGLGFWRVRNVVIIPEREVADLILVFKIRIVADQRTVDQRVGSFRFQNVFRTFERTVAK